MGGRRGVRFPHLLFATFVETRRWRVFWRAELIGAERVFVVRVIVPEMTLRPETGHRPVSTKSSAGYGNLTHTRGA